MKADHDDQDSKEEDEDQRDELAIVCVAYCPYCSNPLALDSRENEVDTAIWLRVFPQAALGVLQCRTEIDQPPKE